jgi:putative hydrolase of HD superfamily
MQDNRLSQQIQFIVEIDKLKRVLRQTLLTDESRQENSAEHSWHLAMMAVLLTEYAPAEVNMLHVIKMLLIHDLVEIDAGIPSATMCKATRKKQSGKTGSYTVIWTVTP